MYWNFLVCNFLFKKTKKWEKLNRLWWCGYQTNSCADWLIREVKFDQVFFVTIHYVCFYRFILTNFFCTFTLELWNRCFVRMTNRAINFYFLVRVGWMDENIQLRIPIWDVLIGPENFQIPFLDYIIFNIAYIQL